MNIVIAFEEPPIDRTDLNDVLEQANFLKQHLEPDHEISNLAYTGEVSNFVEQLSDADIVWNLFETFRGREEASYLGAALLDMAGAPFTGSGVAALAAASDKRIVKGILANVGVATPDTYRPNKNFRAGKWLFKPALTHGSAGITDDSVIDARTELEMKLSMMTRLTTNYFAERYIDGDEYSVTLLDNEGILTAVSCAKMQFNNYPEDKPKILNFDSKWSEYSNDYKQTSRSFDVPVALAEQLRELAEITANVFGFAGFARVDFRQDSATGNLYVIDVNPNPALSADSGFIATCANAGIDAKTTLERIIKRALMH
ncbi:D-alanine--D-alanine ligase [Deferribacterales bacterium RsTz2092]|nr:D-alanine--D-alanine ligase [Deferribacterales bacterium]